MSLAPASSELSSSPERKKESTRSRYKSSLPEKPQASEPLVDLDKLPDLLSAIRKTRISRLESYYAMFHPHTWTLLEVDYEEQRDQLRKLREWRLSYSKRGGSYIKLDAAADELEERTQYVWELFKRLYGLHHLRERYLERYRPLAPDWDDAKIIRKTLGFETTEQGLSVVDTSVYDQQEHNVWPLPLNISVIPNCSNPEALVRLADLPVEEQDRYRLGPLDPDYHTTFRPMSIRAFRNMYNIGVRGDESLAAESWMNCFRGGCRWWRGYIRL